MKNAKKKSKPQESFPILDINATYIIKDDIDKERIILRIDDEEWKDIIVSLEKMNFLDDNSSTLTFDVKVIHNPHDSKSLDDRFYDYIKSITKKLIEYAVKSTNRT